MNDVLVMYRNSPPMMQIPASLREQERADILCEKFSNWILNSKIGDKFCYYQGLHVVGVPVGRVAYRAYESGMVVLLQTKAEVGFNYWAERK